MIDPTLAAPPAATATAPLKRAASSTKFVNHPTSTYTHSPSQEDPPDVLLEGWMLKRSRNSFWQDRYFVFRSDQSISYRRKPDEEEPRMTYRVSREACCEVSDLFLSQRNIGPGASGSVAGKKESLYCVTLSWPDDTETVATSNLTNQGGGGGGAMGLNDSFRDDGSFLATTPMEAPVSPISVASNKQRSSRKKSRPSIKLLRNISAGAGPSAAASGVGGEEASILSGQSLGSRASQIRKSILRRRPLKRGNSSSALEHRNSGDYDDVSIASLLDPPKASRNAASTLKMPRQINEHGTPASAGNDHTVSALGMSMPNINVDLKSRPTRIPVEVSMELLKETDNFDTTDPVENQEQRVEQVELEPLNEQAEQTKYLRRSLKEEYGITPLTLNRKASHEDQTLQEQEMLHNLYLRKQREQRSAMTKRAVGVTKVAVAASAAIGVGIITAGVGLAAGLVFLGGAAAIGGTAGVAEAGLKRTLKRKDHLTIATSDYELAKLWKTTLDACLEQESLKQSTWGQLFAADGRKTTSTFIAHDAGEVMHGLSGDDDDGYLSGGKGVTTGSSAPKDLPKGQTNLFLRDPNFFAQARARWRPLDGGWVSFLGPGAQSLRIFKEERIRVDDSKRVAPLAVNGSTCTPLRTQVVLNAHPMEAFMCIMSYARMHPNAKDDLAPNSGQSASFRLIEKIDEHTDVLHLVCRKLFLFPSWTEARDYVLLRYWRYEPDGSYIICYESMDHPKCPPQRGFVRGQMHQVYTIAPPKTSDHRRLRGTANAAEECMLTTVVQVDPKGWIPTQPLSLLSRQSYADAFGVSALLQCLDIRDAIENDRFLDLSPDLQPSPSMGKSGHRSGNPLDASDLRFVNRERCDSFTIDKFPDIGSQPEPWGREKWAEPDSNSFLVRGPAYKTDRVKVNAGSSIGQLIAADVVGVDEPQYGGMSMHPSERIQVALRREKKLKELGKQSDVPPFVFVVNIILPGPPFYHGVFYFAVDDMSTVDGSDGTASSKLCQRFLFGDSDDFRDNTFKLIPRIVEGNFLVRKAVGSTPAIMGTKLKQYYVRNERFMEVILDCGSSPVATGVIRLSLGYAKTLVVDMGFLLEGDTDEYLPERMFGAVRVKYPIFGPHLRKVENSWP